MACHSHVHEVVLLILSFGELLIKCKVRAFGITYAAPLKCSLMVSGRLG